MAEGHALYEQDFVRWSEEQASTLRAAAASGTNLPLDWDNLAEEIDSLGRSLRSELRNRLATVLEHLLNLTLSPSLEPRAGRTETITRERIEIDALLDENPSLRASLGETLASADRKARRLAGASLRRHGEWSGETARAIEAVRFAEADVLGSGLPKSGP